MRFIGLTTWVVLPVLAVLAAPLAAQPEAIAGFTRQDWNRLSLERDRASIVEGYRRHGHRDPSWDAQAVEFLELCILPFNRLPGAPEMVDLQEAGEALYELGCRDPMVLYGLGYSLDQRNHLRSAGGYFEQAIEGLRESEYPKLRLAHAASRHARYLEAWRRHDEARNFHQLSADTWIEIARTTPDDWFDQRVLTNTLDLQVRDYLPLDIAVDFARRLEALEGLDPVTLHSTLGKYHERMAWEARGDGFSNTVTDEGWAVFAREMAIARDHYVHAWNADPSRPEAPAYMIGVAMSGHAAEGETERLWFDRAVAAQFDWSVAYTGLLWSIRPRWGGSHEAMYAFSLECMTTARYDTDVPYVLVQTLLDIGSDARGDFSFWIEHDVYPAAREVLTNLRADPAHAARADYYRSVQVAVAWGTRRFAEAARLLDELGDRFDTRVLEDELHVSARRVRDDVYLLASPAAMRIVEGDDAFAGDRIDVAVRLYEQAMALADRDPVREAVYDRLVTAQLYRDFLAGGWVPLRFEAGLPGWRTREGAWHSSQPESIKGGPSGDDMRLLCQVPVDDTFELRGHIDLQKLTTSRKPNAGIVFKYRDYLDRSDWQSFLIYSQDKQAWIGYRYWKPRGEWLPLEGKKRIRAFDFHLQVWGNFAMLSLNGEQVFAGELGSGDEFVTGRQFGLAGSFNGYAGYGRFSDLELRRLTEPPAALLDPEDAP